jgi:thiamine pyrophosphokinase
VSGQQTSRAAVVFAAAPLAVTRRTSARLADLAEPYVVAADGGAATALAFGFQPDVVVGDLDSIDAPVLAELRRRGVAVETHPRDKDATDGQLAVERAQQVEPTFLWLLGFLGGPRLDQALANVLYLARLRTPAALLDEQNECRLLLPEHELAWTPEPDEVISLLALSAEVSGVRTTGLRWPLSDDRLSLGDTRGVSNEPDAPRAHVSIEHGLLLVTRHFPEP